MLQRWADHRQAAKLLKKTLVKEGLFSAFDAALKAPVKGDSVLLPGFDLFDRSGSLSPYLWCVPKPKCDLNDLYQAYEDYTDQPLGLLRNPGKPAQILLKNQSSRGTYFGASQRSADWYLPLVKVLAMAQHLDEGRPQRKGSTFSMHLGPGYLEVSPEGCWNNFRRGVVKALRVAQDAGESGFTVTSFRSNHPLALAAFQASQEGDYGILWAANTMLQAEASRLAPSGWCLGGFASDPRPARARGVYKERRRSREGALQAAQECEGLLQECDFDLIAELSRAAVPRLCSSAQFKMRFGSCHNTEARVVGAETRTRWAVVFQELAENV